MSSRYLPTMVLGILLFGCTAACSSAESVTVSTSLPAVTVTPPVQIHETTFPSQTDVPEPPSPSPTALQQSTASPEPYTLPRSDYGPNFIGKRKYSFEDSGRGDR